MSISFPLLTQSEATEIESVVRNAMAERSTEFSLRELFRRWSDLVNEVERKYKLSLYDYTNDLTVRDRLEEVRTLLSAETCRKIDDALVPLDQRFRTATVSVDRPLRNSPHFWWSRIPRDRDPDFDDSL